MSVPFWAHLNFLCPTSSFGAIGGFKNLEGKWPFAVLCNNKSLSADGRLPSGKAVYYWARQQLTRFALRLAKRDLRILVGLLTVHTTLNRHLAIMKIRSDPTCSACGEDKETTLHYLGCCWANSMLRHTIMGSYCLQSEELGRVTPYNLLRFARASKRFQ